MDNYRESSNKKASFFSHRECEAFPCHEAVDEDNFNCLFCYCPLYAFGESCGGNYTYTPQGIKNCENCAFPHRRDSYSIIIKRLMQESEHLTKLS